MLPRQSEKHSISRLNFCSKVSGTCPFVRRRYDETAGIWQARVNRDWRFYFLILDDIYRILKLIPHPK